MPLAVMFFVLPGGQQRSLLARRTAILSGPVTAMAVLPLAHLHMFFPFGL